jgi:hypothetical protein
VIFGIKGSVTSTHQHKTVTKGKTVKNPNLPNYAHGNKHINQSVNDSETVHY